MCPRRGGSTVGQRWVKTGLRALEDRRTDSISRQILHVLRITPQRIARVRPRSAGLSGPCQNPLAQTGRGPRAVPGRGPLPFSLQPAVCSLEAPSAARVVQGDSDGGGTTEDSQRLADLLAADAEVLDLLDPGAGPAAHHALDATPEALPGDV